MRSQKLFLSFIYITACTVGLATAGGKAHPSKGSNHGPPTHQPSPELECDLLDVLRTKGFTELATRIEEYPGLLEEITSRNDLVIYAPPNSAFEGDSGDDSGDEIPDDPQDSHGPRPKKPKHKSTKRAVDRRAPSLVSGNGAGTFKRRRDCSSGTCKKLLPSNFKVIQSLQRDPEFVNLGPGQAARFVTFYAGSDNAQLQIITGQGVVVNITEETKIKFDRGVIHPTVDVFTQPTGFYDTYEAVGSPAQRFYDALVKADLLDYVENTPRLTIFAPVEIKGKINPKDYIVADTLGYSPYLEPGNSLTAISGKEIKITWDPAGGVGKLVGGNKIVKNDIIIKNGVIQFIQGSFSTGCSDGCGGPKYHQ